MKGKNPKRNKLKRAASRQISYYLDLEKDEGMVIFGYFYNCYIEMLTEKEAIVERVKGFCKRNNKKIDYTILVNDYSQYELQVKVINNE
jgi:predicted adenine nucleotide alpha hydrolase (AANH) superfamily ATPase